MPRSLTRPPSHRLQANTVFPTPCERALCPPMDVRAAEKRFSVSWDSNDRFPNQNRNGREFDRLASISHEPKTFIETDQSGTRGRRGEINLGRRFQPDLR